MQVTDQIISQLRKNTGDDIYLLQLLCFSVGRVCRNIDKRGGDWRSDLSQIDLEHIVDWLKAAIMNEENWLGNVDSKSRPLKLMKFGNLLDIVREADKAVLKDIHRNGAIKLVEGDEELFVELNGGWRVVRLLTKSALDVESAAMQHCVGAGSYDVLLEEPRFRFLSLRDKYGKAHATMLLENDVLVQLQGKQNVFPEQKYVDILLAFLRMQKINTNHYASKFGLICDVNFDLHPLDDLPPGLHVRGKLVLHGDNVNTLPNGMIVDGYFSLVSNSILKLPENIRINGALNLDSSSLESLPPNLRIGDDLIITNAKFNSLPDGLWIGCNMYLQESEIGALPADIHVEGSISLCRTNITTLPDNFLVRKSILISGSRFETLPQGMVIMEKLRLASTSVRQIPNDIQIGGDVDIIYSPIESIPDNFSVKGYLRLYKTNITELPDDLRVGQSLDLVEAQITSLPENLKVGGYLDVRDSLVNKLPSGLVVGQDLIISGTPITALPDDLSVCGSIEIEKTNILSLPETIEDCQRIYYEEGFVTAKQFRQLMVLPRRN